jgi:hypothetical protein
MCISYGYIEVLCRAGAREVGKGTLQASLIVTSLVHIVYTTYKSLLVAM